VLVTLLVHSGRRRLTGDRHHRRPIHVGVGDSGHEVRRAGTAVDIGHEGGPLLVARGHKPDRAVEEGVHHIQVLFARNAEHVRQAFVLQAADKQLGGFHGTFLLSDRGLTMVPWPCRNGQGRHVVEWAVGPAPLPA
jgi:hypothetical protein